MDMPSILLLYTKSGAGTPSPILKDRTCFLAKICSPPYIVEAVLASTNFIFFLNTLAFSGRISLFDNEY
jgi:hypothetical protein